MRARKFMDCLIMNIIALALGLLVGSGDAQERVDWAYYGRDAASTKFSPAALINSANFDSLRIIWRRPADLALSASEGIESDRYRSTPIVVNGVLYAISPLNQVSALEAQTGAQLWTFDPQAWKVEGFFRGYARGVSYWSAGDQERIILGTSSSYLYALDAKTGEPDPGFGEGGRIDLTKGLSRPFERTHYAFVSPPIICKNVVVVGSSMMDWRQGRDRQPLMAPGDVRGFDVRSGEQLWTFHAIPHDGEFGADTWEPGAWQQHGAANVWSMMSADDALGYVYLPFSTPDNDFYGGEWPGDNLFGESLVCLKARTGERVWHYQMVHHGLWDYDLPAAPILLDIVARFSDGNALSAGSGSDYSGR
jgi:quinoprotein glucose dehydrogenase